MSVTHLTPVGQYEMCLIEGGTHRFEITTDEMPGLIFHPQTSFGVRLGSKEALSFSRGVWRGILAKLAEADALCTFRLTAPGICEVTCYVPVPSARKHEMQSSGARDLTDKRSSDNKRESLRFESANNA